VGRAGELLHWRRNGKEDVDWTIDI